MTHRPPPPIPGGIIPPSNPFMSPRSILLISFIMFITLAAPPICCSILQDTPPKTTERVSEGSHTLMKTPGSSTTVWLSVKVGFNKSHLGSMALCSCCITLLGLRVICLAMFASP